MATYRYAFSLSKQEVGESIPPGTAKLVDHTLARTETGHHETQVDHIRLVPEPSRDPADPLNWAAWRKSAILGCICVYAFIANVAAASLSSAIPFLAMDFYTEGETGLTHLIAVNTLFLGCANIWWVPLANTFGRRPIILINLLILMLCAVWAAKSKSFGSLLAARLFQGIGGAAADTVAPDIIGEVFFRHQRGRAMALYTVALITGSIVGGLFGSYLAAAHGWRWTQWLNVILAGVVLLACFLFQPETLFDRRAAMAGDVTPVSEGNPTGENGVENEKAAVKHVEASATPRTFAPFTFARSLKIGAYRGNFPRHLIAPWLTLRYPAVWLVMLHYSGLVGGIVTISAIGPQLLSMPPYLWGANAGLINVGGLIGAILGGIYTYLIGDRLLKRQAKGNALGFSEPESRLPSLLPGLFCATFGMIIFGFSGRYPAPHAWVGMQFGYGMVAFGLMQVPSIGFNYLIECYHAVSGDCFVMVTSMRAIISFAWTFFVSTWVAERGAAEPFGIFGMLMGVFSLLTIPIYFYGKRIRIGTARWVPKKEEH